MSNYIPDIKNRDRYYHEFNMGGFIADLVVGDSKECQYLLVEFEDGTPNSVFTKKGNKKRPPAWAGRMEGAYSQLTDWLWKLDGERSSKDFLYTFGDQNAEFHGLIVIGKNMHLDKQEQDRLKWRMKKTIINSYPFSIVSFDRLCEDMDYWLTTYHGV